MTWTDALDLMKPRTKFVSQAGKYGRGDVSLAVTRPKIGSRREVELLSLFSFEALPALYSQKRWKDRKPDRIGMVAGRLGITTNSLGLLKDKFMSERKALPSRGEAREAQPS